MDLLEELVRDTLAEHAEHAPTVAALLSRERRRDHRAATRWVAAGLAAAAVAAIAVGATVIARHHGSATGPAIGNSGSPEPIPAGQKAISYHGIEILVPAALPIADAACGPQQQSQIFLAADLTIHCPNLTGNEKSAPGLTTVTLSPLLPSYGLPGGPQDLARTKSTIDGRPALIGFGSAAFFPGDVVGVLELKDPGVFIEVTTPNKAATEAMLRTVRVIAVDRLGCRSHVPSVIPAGNPPAAELVPGSPVSAIICQYPVGDYNDTGDYYDTYNLWLLQSSTLSSSTTRRVAALINDLPAHKAAGLSPNGIHDLITFTYADGSTRTVDALVYTQASRDATPLVTDGNRTVDDVDGALGSLLFH